jgi:hypothetical protein
MMLGKLSFTAPNLNNQNAIKIHELNGIHACADSGYVGASCLCSACLPKKTDYTSAVVKKLDDFYGQGTYVLTTKDQIYTAVFTGPKRCNDTGCEVVVFNQCT